MADATLFDTTTVGGLQLANRAVMAPMTRSRANDDGVPTEMMATYYAQRASAGLIITEGTQPNAVGQGYPFTPGLHTAEQVTGWRSVTEAVHAEGGKIFAQIMHTGRIGHPSLLPDGQVPLAPSAVRPAGQVFTADGMQDFVVPQAMTVQDITDTVADYATAARLAVEAGFDGVEIHGANGYLPHQFLASGTNQRTDEYGGSPVARTRFLVEVMQAVVAAIGAGRVGFRLSPGNDFNDISEDDVMDTYTSLLEQLVPLGPAYLHIVEAREKNVNQRILGLWEGTLIVNPSPLVQNQEAADKERADQWLARGADLIAFGRMFIANPDFVERLATDAPLNEADGSTFYGGTEVGYTDYPTLVTSS
ncbi:alkene reductase [Arthrobacter sp. CAN_C5]|uniref:alkene reductase n=1 Tax=Arthrobacter sp. CAN_C5 TaxID=2760706 RepID=UPI001AE25AAF|nr:alkene reductase [Arthrobacter sp. CAN_C5]MBP2218065.1 N-ethylmaleimide reductase [Arthrobacter sp. CAN_C5]